MRAKSGRWRLLGEEGTAGLGLPQHRARSLALQHGWRTVAGDRLADRVRADGVRAGVLELIAEGKPWRDAMLPAVPALAARLASLHPQLAIRRVRLRLEGEAAPPPAQVVPVAPGGSGRVPAPPRRAPETGGQRGDEPPEVRLTRLARGYLERAGRRRD